MLTRIPQDDPTHRRQHGGCRRQRLGRAERTPQILVESEQQPVADREGKSSPVPHASAVPVLATQAGASWRTYAIS